MLKPLRSGGGDHARQLRLKRFIKAGNGLKWSAKQYAIRQAAEQAGAVDLPKACPACGTLPEEMEHDPTCPLLTASH
jgi:hypothetical protein